MAQYSYDEQGGMAAYLVLTFLSVVLIPLTYSFVPARSGKEQAASCTCSECKRKQDILRKRKQRSLLSLRVGPKALVTLALWALFSYTLYKVATTKIESSIYDPFQILGIRAGTSEKDIKRHYKKLSLKFHPDKVKLAVNETLEMVSNQFVEFTKAYKSLTDETVRRNLELYGHPDGKQEYSVGIALPRWIVESQNNIWVLGLYGLVFGLGLPFMVGRWWFSSRKYTKDHVQARTATLFFKNFSNDSDYTKLVELLGCSSEWETAQPSRSSKDVEALDELVQAVRSTATDWEPKGEFDVPVARRATALLLAHLHRIPLPVPSLQQEQCDLLLQTPSLLNCLLSIALAHNWLQGTVRVMRLHAALAQAVMPGSPTAVLKQLPGVKSEDVEDASTGDIKELMRRWQQVKDERLEDAKKAAATWGRLEVVDVYFKVIGEKVVTPGAIVFLVVKLRLEPLLPSTPPTQNGHAENDELDLEQIKKNNRAKEEKENAFLLSKADGEDLSDGRMNVGWTHAPYWPDNRKPQWWIFLGDLKSEKVVVPPIRISNVPLSNKNRSTHNYRTYKLQFQAPPNAATYSFNAHFVSDTFIGQDVVRDVKLQVVDPSELGAEGETQEDEISDPDEDTLEGQLAAMKGGQVKRSPVHGGDEDEEDEDESGTDEESDDSRSDSDSD